MKKLHLIVISSASISAIFFTLLSLTYYDFFTPIAKENTFGVKAQVMKSPPSMCPNKCPDYLIRFSSNNGVAITGFYICKGLSCVKQDETILLNPPRGSYGTTAITSDVPWQVGDNVDIRLKVAPISIIGNGINYSPAQANLLDLGISEVIAG